MERNIYENKDGLKFYLNDDPTMKEAIEIEKLMSGLMVIDNKTIKLEQTLDQNTRLLELLTVPAEKLPESFEYSSFRGTQSMEIITDFFLSMIGRVNTMMNLTRKFQTKLKE